MASKAKDTFFPDKGYLETIYLQNYRLFRGFFAQYRLFGDYLCKKARLFSGQDFLRSLYVLGCKYSSRVTPGRERALR